MLMSKYHRLLWHQGQEGRCLVSVSKNASIKWLISGSMMLHTEECHSHPRLSSHKTSVLNGNNKKICSNMFSQLPSVKHNNKLSYLVRNINLFSFLHTDFKVLLFWHSSKANKLWPLRMRIETQRCYFAVCRPQTHFSADKWSSLWGTLAGCDLREGR